MASLHAQNNMQPQSNKVDLPNILSSGEHCNFVSLRTVFMALRRVFGLICGHVRSRGHLSSSVVEFCKNTRKTVGCSFLYPPGADFIFINGVCVSEGVQYL